MRRWTHKISVVIAVICITLGMIGIFHYKWNEIYQKNKHEKLVEQMAEGTEETAEGVERSGESDGNHETEYVSPIDFDALLVQNSDVIAWIKIPGTMINYPVVQGDDNDYYLHHDLDGEDSVYGTIFLDYADEPDFSSRHNIFYGHHMKDGSMFKDISRYKEQGYFDAHKEIILYMPDREIHLKAIAAVCTTPDAIRRKSEFASDEEFSTYIQQMTENASAFAPVDGTITHLYSFVTCSYEFNDARTILYAYETEE